MTTAIERWAPRKPRQGCWFRALRFADEKTPDPNRFAVCAFPESEAAGPYMYIIDESNRMYRKAEGRSLGIEVFPADPLKEGWTIVD